MAQEGIIFDSRSGQRIGNAVKWVESQSDDLNGGDPYRPSIYDRTFWARIEGASALGSSQYKYAWTEVVQQANAFVDKTGGRSGTTSSGYALNGSERGTGGPPLPSGLVVLIKFGIEFPDASTSKANYTFYAVPPPLFPVTVSQTGGTAGDASTACSFTYDVTYNGQTIGTGLSPDKGRLVNCAMVAGTRGVAYYEGGSVGLWDVNETAQQQNCSSGGG